MARRPKERGLMMYTYQEMLERAIRFYSGSPDGQYDEFVVKALSALLDMQKALDKIE